VPPNHESSLVGSRILPLFFWVALVWLAASRVSAADVGYPKRADLIVVPVTITNHSGEAVSGVKGSQFLVLDNGESRPVVSFEPDQRPMSIVVVVDTSASMGSSMEQTRLALRNFAASAGPRDEMALLTFSGHPQVVNDFTCDFAPLMSKLVAGRAADYTALDDALWQALQMMRRGHNPRKAVVVITDVRENHSRHAPELMNAVRESDVQVYGVEIHYLPFSMWRSESGLVESLAKVSGGLSVEIGSAKEVPQAVEKITNATHSLYRIGFNPSPISNSGRWHKIQVRLTDPNLGRLRVNAQNSYKESGSQ
jgi:VWFA-related protein